MTAYLCLKLVQEEAKQNSQGHKEQAWLHHHGVGTINRSIAERCRISCARSFAGRRHISI